MPVPSANFPGANRQPLDYPGARPDYSFVYLRGHIYKVEVRGTALADLWVVDGIEIPLDDFLTARGNISLSERTAVLAVGSNACPGRLEEKYAATPVAAIPVLLGTMTETSVVYSCRLASYGALPATYVRHPGATSRVSVTLLSDDQLEAMDKSESFYRRSETSGVFTMAGGLRIERPFAYLDRRVLSYRGAPVQLKTVAAEGLDWPAMDEREVLALVLDEAGMLPGEAIEIRQPKLQGEEALKQQLRDFLDSQMSGLTVDETGALR